MKNLKKVLTMSRDYKDHVMVNQEKLTIVNQKMIYIQNYQELIEITDNQITLKNVKISGTDLKISKISKYYIEITGLIESVNYLGVN